MANCFTFAKRKSIVVEDSTWTNQVVTQSPLSFSNTEDSLNESYATAADENETQYLSVLESTTGDHTLEDIHDITLGSQKLLIQDTIGLNVETISQDNFNVAESEEQQVVIFNVEGSNELYGIQVAQDNDGNVHRYQFQLRKTGDGQLEPMPETVQLLANEEDQQVTEEQQDASELNADQINEEEFEEPVYLQAKLEQTDGSTQSHLFISKQTKKTNVKKEVTNLYREDLEENYEEADINLKSEINLATLKEEFIQQQNEECQDTEEALSVNFDEDFTSEATSYDAAEINHSDQEAVIDFDNQIIEEQYEDGAKPQNNRLHFEQLFIHDQPDEIRQYHEEFQPENEESSNILIIEKDAENNESEHEDYEFVSQLPVSAEDINEEESVDEEAGVWYSEPEIPVESVKLTENSLLKTTNILKQPTNTVKRVDPKKKAILYYMVPKTDQKENVNSIPYTNTNSNPRSLLKNSLDLTKINEDNIKKLQREKLMERRYARSKEAMQAKMFNNFINKTTIPHAPVRQGRLPRKQQIKPVDTRRNEEIIVQEVMVSSKGFVESVSDRLKNLEVTSIVELSDSDDDKDLTNGTKKKKKHKKTNSSSTAITSDSEGSVIEIIHTDDETDDTSFIVNTVKKGPGRPKKNTEDISKRSHELETNKENGSGSSTESTPSKKSRTDDSSEVESDTNKQDTPEISCPLCSKSFPNQNSLSTHLQHHNLENTLRSNTKRNLEYRHNCDKCQQSFKNSILLKKHVCNISKELKNTHKCGVCSKTFKDITLFNIHKKSHIKENLIKTTTSVTISPKKFTSRPSTALKAPVSFNCKVCSKVCSSQIILTIHEKSHKKFVCANCNTSFTSKILLDSHVRVKCVKNSSPKDRRLSFKIRKSFISSPRLSSIRGKSLNTFKPPGATSTKNINIPASSARKSIIPSSSATRSVNPSNVVRKSTIPSSSARKSIVPISSARKSIVPSSSARKSMFPSSSARKSVIPTDSARKSFAPRSTSASSSVGIPGHTSIRTKQILNPLFKDSGNTTKNANSDLNTSNFVKNLEVEIQCDTCTMKFTNWTSLFKHKVKNHGLYTPDQKVLKPKRKTIYKPLTLHGGIPANEKLNKAFQAFRRNLAMINTTEELKLGDKSEQKEDNVLPQIVVSEPSHTKQ
ncbi:uncharacterized protein LOC114345708 [Diabrotica virgifera virgifera]|uniref:C2H2-type domain-containing protein n=1 Tax=Diabrotica virgifera virgifera TaxID=50390 RepID=A0ABM5IZG4_DIAVI|nr:uncharacterized protein LOC114345708 [Diabrotica virgifera virgifera]